MKNSQVAPALVTTTLVLAFLAGRGSQVFAGTPTYREITVTNGGTVHGVVRLAGGSSKAPRMEITKDPDFCGKKATCPRIYLGQKQGVQYALVYLEGIDRGKKASTNKLPVLSQRRCTYEPHVLILPMGQELEIVNSDPILHNVHAYDLQGESRTIFNVAQPIKGQRTRVKMSQMLKPGIVFATCDAGHPWMSSYIVVAEHPYYAVTDANGKFSFENVPSGTYKIRMWHEGVQITKTEVENGKVKKYYFEEPYLAEKEVTVAESGTAAIEFEFSLR